MTNYNNEKYILPLLEALTLQENTTSQLRKQQKRRQQIKRNGNQQIKNDHLSVLPSFDPCKSYHVVFINRLTSTSVVHDLIAHARKTKQFTIDTENDYDSHKPALIQIEMIGCESIVLLVEMCHLPHVASTLFWLIKALFKIVLNSSKKIFSWGDIAKELTHFVDYNLFNINQTNIKSSMDVQGEFKKWYNKTFPHDSHCQRKSNDPDDDDRLCKCPHRPYKNPNERWSLQKAIDKTFHQFLDKNLRTSNWGRGLDPCLGRDYQTIFRSRHRRQKMKQSSQIYQLQDLIQYVVDDCLAVTKLAPIVEHKWSLQQLVKFNEAHNSTG